MFRISKLTDYSTVVMSYLAREPEGIHNARDIMEHTGIALPTISKILKILAKAGLLQSHRGASGGYSLALPPEKIPVARILAAMEGNIGLTECSTHKGNCSLEPLCHIRSNWQSISHVVHNALSSITLADMVNPIANIQFSVTRRDALRETPT